MKNNIILFDIDYTIFNTARYKKKITEYIYHYFHLEKEKVELFDAQYQLNTQKGAGINIKDYSEKIANQFSLSSERIFSLIMDNRNLYLHSLYPDTLPTLTLLSKEYTLGIFSQGYEFFQINKLKQMGVLHFFDEKYIYIFPDKIHAINIAKLPKNAVVVDDKHSVIESLLGNMQTIHIDRENKATRGTFPIIHSLSELPEAITRLTEPAK
jgi:FMN phosphatase YigB (HAD superfamily)